MVGAWGRLGYRLNVIIAPAMSSWTIFQNISILNGLGIKGCSCPYRCSRIHGPAVDLPTGRSNYHHDSFPVRWCSLSPRNVPSFPGRYPDRLRFSRIFSPKTRVLPTTRLEY